jgi:glutathionylspermidine synthase
MPGCAETADVEAMPCRALEPLGAASFDRIRRQMLLSHCKWDPQVGDVSTLAPFPLAISRSTWRQLAQWAEALAAEAAAAEVELLARPEMHRMLGLPRSIRKLLGRAKRLTPGIARVIRFDFHPTLDGWRISEANSDVPGGFTESSSFTQLMAEHYPQTSHAGNPTDRWARAMAAGVGSRGRIGLLVAPGYMEDQQVVQYLARALRQHGLEAEICGPGRALSRFDAIVRFYQGEWLARLPKRLGWPHLFIEGHVPVCNPGTALLTESKRFPLVWDALRTRLPMWRKLLPETRDPREVNWASDSSWLLKAAFCNNGDEVAIRSALAPAQWRKAARSARWNPSGWVAQRRFQPVAVETPIGPMQPCFGVYTIEGKATGIYGRVTAGAVIDYSAIDVAVLVEEDAGEGGEP